MKRIRKISLLIMALLLCLTLCGAAFAAEAPTEAPAETAETAVTETAETTVTETASAAQTNGRQIVLVPYDENGNIVGGTGLAGCTGGATLFVNHKYRVVACYYEQANNKIVETSDKLLIDVECDNPALTYEGNVINIEPAPNAFSFTVRIADPTAEGGEVKYTAQVTRFNFSIIELLIAGVGIYLIVNAIRGKSNTFSDEFIKDEKKPLFRKLALLAGILSGLALIAAAVLSICFSYLEWTTVARYVCLGLAFVLLIGIAVVNSLFTDKEKRDKAESSKYGKAPSSAAFEFDGTEPTLDEVLADIDKEQKDSGSN